MPHILSAAVHSLSNQVSRFLFRSTRTSCTAFDWRARPSVRLPARILSPPPPSSPYLPALQSPSSLRHLFHLLTQSPPSTSTTQSVGVFSNFNLADLSRTISSCLISCFFYFNFSIFSYFLSFGSFSLFLVHTVALY